MPSKLTRRHSPNRPLLLEPLEQRALLAAVTIGVNNAQTFQTMEGFGAAMTPWDFKDEYASSAFFDLIVNDLGASMARAAILPTAEKVNDNNDPNTFNFAGFDHKALSMPFEFFKALSQRGVGKFVGSVWTAPDWMKTNLIYTDGGSLRPDMRAEFAEYLSAVVKLAKNDYGVDLTAISPQNEPYFVEPYESTTYNADQLREAVRAVMRKFAADGVTTKLLVPEDLIFEHRNEWYLSRIMSDPETKNFVGGFAGHGLASHWPEVRAVFEKYGRPFWMTETSGQSATWEGAMGVATSIMNAVGTANANSYLYWQFSEDAIDQKYSLMTDGVPNPKYYAAKQFYRWIRPGFVHVGSSSSLPDQVRTASFRNPATGAMTHVIVNLSGDVHNVTLNVSGSNLPGSYKVYRSSSSEQTAFIGNIGGGTSFGVNVPGLSVTTITSAPELTPKTGGAMNPATAVPTQVSDFVSRNGFFEAALKGYISSLTGQINNGANVNQVAPNGWTPLHAAAGSVHTGALLTLQKLIDSGANVNAVTNEGWTALHAAAANTFLKFDSAPTAATRLTDKINMLVNAGVNVNAKDASGRTALHWAAWMGAVAGTVEDTQALDALIARGADPFIKDNFGKTALDYARSEGYKKIPDPLIKAMGLDKIKPTGDVLNVAPDPRNSSVTDFFVKFSERVVGFDLLDVVLTHNGVPLALPTGAAITTEDEINYQLSGFGGHTSAPGAYVLSIKAAGSGIADPSGNPLAADFSDSWTNGDDPPPPPPGEQTPWNGTPFGVTTTRPTVLDLEEFDNGGEGIAYHDLDTVNSGGAFRTSGVDIQPTTYPGGGHNIAYVKAGEWLEYTINVAEAGAYEFAFNVASPGSNAKFHAEIDGVNVTGALTVPNTGGWQTWSTASAHNVNLSAGTHVLRVAFDANGSNGSVGNFDAVTFAPEGDDPPPPPPQQTPFNGLPFIVNKSGSTKIQVEDFDNGGAGVAWSDTTPQNYGGAYRTTEVDIQPTADAGGGHNVGYTKAGEWLEYSLNVTEAGTYDLGFRIASATSNGRFHAEIDGVDVTGSLLVPNTGAWQGWQTRTKSGVSLAAGQHVLRLALDRNGDNGSLANFNYITITPQGTPPPPPPTNQTPFSGTPFAIGAGTATIQLEDFDNGGEAIAYHDIDTKNEGGKYRTTGVDVSATTDTGGGFNVGFVKAGEWLEYTLDVAEGGAGSYDLAFRVASGGGGGKFHAEIDGANVTGSLSIPNTGGWQTWANVTRTAVPLPAGQHVLRVFMESNGATGSVGNFNHLKLTPTPLPPPPPPTQTPFKGTPFTVGTTPVTIQVEDFDNGGEGIAFHDLDVSNNGGAYRTGAGNAVDIEPTGDAGGGHHVAFTQAGEWLEYTLNVSTADTYSFDFRAASNGPGGTFRALIDGADVTGTLSVPNTGGWNVFQTVSKPGIALSAGQHVLRLSFASAGAGGFAGNFNWMRITKA